MATKGKNEPEVYTIVFTPDADADLDRLRAYDQRQVIEGIKLFLRHEPLKVSKARIKRLRGFTKPQYRLRIGDELRVFYDVRERRVEVLAVISKTDMHDWLKEKGIPSEED